MEITREQFFAIPLAEERVPVPELGDGAHLLVRELTADELETWREQAFDRQGDELVPRATYRATLLTACVRQPDGTPFFAAEDQERFTKVPARVLYRLLNAAQRVTRISEPVEDAVKN